MAASASFQSRCHYSEFGVASAGHRKCNTGAFSPQSNRPKAESGSRQRTGRGGLQSSTGWVGRVPPHTSTCSPRAPPAVRKPDLQTMMPGPRGPGAAQQLPLTCIQSGSSGKSCVVEAGHNAAPSELSRDFLRVCDQFTVTFTRIPAAAALSAHQRSTAQELLL